MSDLLVWYDGGCPVCRHEIALMQRLDHKKAIRFLDVTSSDTACPISRSALLARFHAVEDGRLLSGAAAFAAMWRAIPLLRPLGLAARLPLVLAVLERLYRLFLNLRPQLQLLTLRIEAKGVRRLASRTKPTSPMAPKYRNTPTVVVVRVPIGDGLLAVRRVLPGLGYGMVALPGGFQMLGETWQEAGAREVLEECGVVLDPASLRLLAVVTTPDKEQNLLFCESPPVDHAGPFVHDSEVSEVLVLHEPVATAFPLHTAMVADHFDRASQSPERARSQAEP